MEHGVSLEDAWHGFFLSLQAGGCSKDTLTDYRKYYAHFRRWHGQPDVPLDTSKLIGFFAWLRQQPNGRGGKLGPKSAYNAWVALRSFYRWYSEEFNIPNPLARVPAPKLSQPAVEPFTRDEVAALLRACERGADGRTRPQALRDRTIMVELLDTGLRASELCALVRSDVDLASGKILVRAGKGGMGRLVYASAPARKLLWRYLATTPAQADAPLFQTRDGGRLTRQHLVRLLAHAGQRAGIPRCHPHRFRHTFATEFLRNGGNLLTLQRLLGHSSLDMVRRYAKIVEADLARAHDAGSPVARWRIS